jgi:hypothetical protein
VVLIELPRRATTLPTKQRDFTQRGALQCSRVAVFLFDIAQSSVRKLGSNVHRGILMCEMTSRSDNMSRGNKYDDAGNVLLASSSGRLWRGAHAELRSHRALTIETFVQPVTEVAIVIDGHARIDRRGNSSTQRFDSKPGTFCICPEGVPVDYLQSKGGNVKILHLYMGNEAETPAGRISDKFRRLAVSGRNHGPAGCADRRGNRRGNPGRNRRRRVAS